MYRFLRRVPWLLYPFLSVVMVILALRTFRDGHYPLFVMTGVNCIMVGLSWGIVRLSLRHYRERTRA